jgi:dolichyl-phosphate beta-glucosyltransferase
LHSLSLLQLCIILKVSTTPFPVIKRHKEEEYFLDPVSGKKHLFPSIDDEPTVELSVIIPAYEEEKRLPVMLEECLEFLELKLKSNPSFSYEVIVVSDGSRDKTVETALQYSKKLTCQKFRVLELIENRGKGGAVRLGMLSSRGKYLLFADADGATKFSDYTNLERSILKLTDTWQKDAISIGSRAHLEEESTAKRSVFRTILMHGFHLLVWIFAVKDIKDTQCGFKVLTRAAARTIFSSMHVEKWAFDVELLYIAQTFKMPIDEIAVNWTEIEGSKITPFFSWIQMGRGKILSMPINISYSNYVAHFRSRINLASVSNWSVEAESHQEELVCS